MEIIARSSYARSNSLIMLNPISLETAQKLEQADFFIGCGAEGFLFASFVANVLGKKVALLRNAKKTYGLERILEGPAPLVSDKLCLVRAKDSSVPSEELIGRPSEFSVILSATEVIEDWSESFQSSYAQSIRAGITSSLEVSVHERPAGFTLSSGEIRPIYFDVFTALLGEGFIPEMLERCDLKLQEYETVVAMANGGIYLGAALANIVRKRPFAMDHDKTNFLVPVLGRPLGRTLFVDESIGTGKYFEIAAQKLRTLCSSIDYFVAAKFNHRGPYPMFVRHGICL